VKLGGIAIAATPGLGLVVAAGLLLAAGPAASGGKIAADTSHHPAVSSAALYSKAAQVNKLGHEDPSLPGGKGAGPGGPEAAAASQVNADWNTLPQDEATIAVDPTDSSKWVVSANDYAIGEPIVTGVYTNDGVNYLPPVPLLAGVDGSNFVVEPPIVTGDPNVVYSNSAQMYILGSIAFSASFCEQGVFVYRSTDGKTWTRPVVPDLGGPLGTAVYWDKLTDCTVLIDKDGVAVDNTGGSHDGRVYVTWTQFQFDSSGNYLESPIEMAYSDDNGDTFSKPTEVSGKSRTLCKNQSSGKGDDCDEDGFAVPIVLSDGKLAIAFPNEQGAGFTNGFRSQYLVTVWDPGPKRVTGPFKVADLSDGENDFPLNSEGRPTLCNSNFRYGSQGNIAAGSNNTAYLVYSDDAKHAGEFPLPTSVDSSPPYACPSGKATDADVYVWKSTDGGQHWTNVTPAAAKAANDQFYPWVAADGAGHVSVVFYDRSSDGGNKLAATSLIQSSNGGASWPKTSTVSDFASNFDDAFFGDGSFIGDYNGNVIDSDGASHPVWTGVTPAKQDSDIFAKTVAP
jgi:hypothetical protein